MAGLLRSIWASVVRTLLGLATKASEGVEDVDTSIRLDPPYSGRDISSKKGCHADIRAVGVMDDRQAEVERGQRIVPCSNPASLVRHGRDAPVSEYSVAKS